MRTHLRCWKRCHEGNNQMQDAWGFSVVPGKPCMRATSVRNTVALASALPKRTLSASWGLGLVSRAPSGRSRAEVARWAGLVPAKKKTQNAKMHDADETAREHTA